MQQATCAHSGADTGTSPGNFRQFSASRRGIIGALAAAPLALAVAPAAATSASPWANAEARYSAACNAASQYFEAVYQPLWKRFEEACGPQPPMFVDITFGNGSSRRYRFDPTTEWPPFQTYDPGREAQRRYVEWSDRSRKLERDPAWSAASDELDRLYDEEYLARKALMATAAPDQRALAFKLRLALENDDFLSIDREHLLADATRILNG